LPSETASRADAGQVPNAREGSGQFFRIEVRKPARDGHREKRGDIRVPVAGVRSGLELGSLFQGFQDYRGSGSGEPRGGRRAPGRDIDFDHLDMAQLETLIGQVGDVSIDVDDGRATIRIVRE